MYALVSVDIVNIELLHFSYETVTTLILIKKPACDNLAIYPPKYFN